MIRRTEIAKMAFAHEVPEKTIEKDYVITKFLRELGPDMAGLGLRFKGGTCLKKGHFADYRFSEDLDFTLEAGGDVDEAEATLRVTSAVLTEEDVPFDLGEPERRASGMTFMATTIGPLSGAERLKIDLTTREMLCFPAVTLAVNDEYSDRGGAVEMHCYSVEEIFLEKMVCMLDPARIQPRDLYDLDYLVQHGQVDVEGALWHFAEKAHFKGHDPSRLHTAVDRKSAQLRARWESQLAQQIPREVLPGYDGVERRFGRLMREHGLG